MSEEDLEDVLFTIEDCYPNCTVWIGHCDTCRYSEKTVILCKGVDIRKYKDQIKDCKEWDGNSDDFHFFRAT